MPKISKPTAAKPKKKFTPFKKDKRVDRLQFLLDKIKPVPLDWIDEESEKEQISIEPLFCDKFTTLDEAWEEAMEWTEGLRTAFIAMLASIVSTKMLGDQLWLKIIGPAACGKSTLCEALSSNKKHILAKSTIRGFHSGYGDASEDNSLIAQLGGKTLITKDGDTLLQSPNYELILSEARDIYDTVSRTHYRNKAARDYEGVRLTWLLCGTSSLKALDQSELGERFLDCEIMDKIDDDLEDRVLLRVVEKSINNLNIESSTSLESQQTPEMLKVMQLTSGYINYLKDNATELLNGVTVDQKSKLYCAKLGKFVAYMRARPSKKQTEIQGREFAARLASQLSRAAKCIAVVLNKKRVDLEVLKLTRKLAMDTAKGPTLDICATLIYNKNGLEANQISLFAEQTPARTRELIHFLRKIGVLEIVSSKSKATKKYKITPNFYGLYKTVIK